MELWAELQSFYLESGPLTKWLMMFIAAGLILTFGRGYLRARKIQPNGFRWKTFRNEIFFGVVNVTISGAILGFINTTLTNSGWVSFDQGPVEWWVITLEFAFYFFAFDAYFYWLHRWMHLEPMYTWIHKLHHRSITPNPMTTISVSPLESLINGGFLPLFIASFTVHEATFALIAPFNIIMGLYVHSGFEFLPRWWNKTWATRWFITATFHDQHHRYFKGNYGGYTTIWDYICGTERPNYLADFDKIKARASEQTIPATARQAGIVKS